MSNSPFKFSNTGVSPMDVPIAANLEKTDFSKTAFYAVEDPLTITDGIPKDLKAAGTKMANNIAAPVKCAFNLFGTFEEAAGYCQRMNRPLVILTIRPDATSVPQIALVSKLVA